MQARNNESRGRAWALLAMLFALGCGEDGGGSGEGDETSGRSQTSDGLQTSEGPVTGNAESSDSSTGGQGATPVVLVHGAWMAGWAWEDVAPSIEAAGHPTVVVDLPAHGDDGTPAADATLAAYRDEVIAQLDALGQPAAVVGHSMGGMVISEVGEARPEAITTLVYVGAFLPESGQSLFDIGGMDAESITAMHLVDHGDGTASIDPEFIGEIFCADCSDEAIQSIIDRTRPEPVAPLLTPASLTDAAFGSVHKAYVHTELDMAVSLGAQEAMLEATPVDEVRSLATSHSPFFSQPQMLADTIVELVEAAP